MPILETISVEQIKSYLLITLLLTGCSLSQGPPVLSDEHSGKLDSSHSYNFGIKGSGYLSNPMMAGLNGIIGRRLGDSWDILVVPTFKRNYLNGNFMETMNSYGVSLSLKRALYKDHNKEYTANINNGYEYSMLGNVISANIGFTNRIKVNKRYFGYSADVFGTKTIGGKKIEYYNSAPVDAAPANADLYEYGHPKPAIGISLSPFFEEELMGKSRLVFDCKIVVSKADRLNVGVGTGLTISVFK